MSVVKTLENILVKDHWGRLGAGAYSVLSLGVLGFSSDLERDYESDEQGYANAECEILEEEGRED